MSLADLAALRERFLEQADQQRHAPFWFWPCSGRSALVDAWRCPIKVLSWIIVLLGLWEFGDIAALFVPGFGNIPAYLWNHILVGLVLVITGVWAARTNNAATARTLSWIAVAAGAWLVIATFLLRRPIPTIGSLNDIIVGVAVIVLGVWAALTWPRTGR